MIMIVEKLINEDGRTILAKIEDLINEIKRKNEKHPDVVTGIRPSLSFICFTKILCQKGTIKDFLPYLTTSI